MVSANTNLVAKLKSHSKVGLRVKIHKPRVKLKSFKRDNLNIQILGFHSTILDKYKILGNFFLEQNFRFLQFIAPVGKGDVFLKKAINTKVITKEKIKKVVETIYKDKEKLVEDFRLKELINQRAELLYNEQKLNDTKEIKEVLTKELDKFSRNLDTTQLDDRIILYTKLNNYLNTININHQNIEYKIDKNLYLNYSSKEVKNIIKKFETIDSVEYKKVDEYIQNIQNIIKPIGVTLKKDEIVVDQKTINKILNIKNITSVNEITPLFTKTFENSILKTSENILQILNKNSVNIQSEEIVNLSENITINIEKQLKTLFKNVSFTSEYKNIFINELKTIFLNSEYTQEIKINEIHNSINTYVTNIVEQNQNKQSFKVENKKVIQEKIYEQSVQKLVSLGINLHFTLKNDLRAIINTFTKSVSVNSVQKYNQIVNDVVEQFLVKQENNILNNTSILKKYTNHNTTVLNERNIDTTVNHIKLANNLSIINNIEQKVGEVYENIINEIKQSSKINHINEQEKSLIFQNIEQILRSGEIVVSNKHLELIKQFAEKIETIDINVEQFINENKEDNGLIVNKLYTNTLEVLNKNISVEQLNKIDKNELLKKIINISKLSTTQEVNKSYQLLLKSYVNINIDKVGTKIQNIVEKNIVAKQISTENIYKNIVNEINTNTTNKYINIVNKNDLLKKITKLTKLSNITQINKEYQNILNDYKIETISIRNIHNEMFNLTKLGDNVNISNSIEQRVEALYENIIKEIKAKEPLKEIRATQKTKILKDIQRVVKLDSIEQINKEYKTILNQFVKNVENTNIINEKLQVDVIYENILTQIKQVQPLVQITSTHKSKILQKVQNIVKLDSIQKVNKEYKVIVEEFTGNLVEKNTTNQMSVDKIYKNIVNEINTNTTNKYINIVNKNEILKKITNLTKLSNVSQINKEYQNIINEYKIDSKNIYQTDIINMTKLGNNVSITNNYEQKMENIYQNIVKEIKKSEPLKQINKIEKSQILQKIDKIVKLDNPTKANREYKSIIEQFVYKTKTKETTRESIINKLIASAPKELKDIQKDTQEIERTKTFIKNTYKTKIEKEQADSSLIYVNGSELKKKKQQKTDSEIKDVDYKLNEKEYQFTMNIENIYKNFDENLDELALKIFREIKDELSMQYKRI